MIILNHIDRKWYVFNKETNTLELRKDAPKEIQILEEENNKNIQEMEDYIFRDFKKKKNVKLVFRG